MAHSNPPTLQGRSTAWAGCANLTQVPAGKAQLDAELALRDAARGLVLFAHGSQDTAARRSRELQRGATTGKWCALCK